MKPPSRLKACRECILFHIAYGTGKDGAKPNVAFVIARNRHAEALLSDFENHETQNEEQSVQGITSQWETVGLDDCSVHKRHN